LAAYSWLEAVCQNMTQSNVNNIDDMYVVKFDAAIAV
jgi:hypothetical protein